MIKEITEKGRSCTNLDMIEHLRVGEGNWQNELLMFIKPEVFFLKSQQDTERVVQLIFDKLDKFNVKIEGMYALNGTFLERNNIMSRHYGYINVLSNSASKTLDPKLIVEIEKVFGLAPGTYEILGGHEYLNKYKNETPLTLDDFWLQEKSAKIRSGVYVRNVKKDGKNIVLVNAFHPKQLGYFTDPAHNIVIMLAHSDTDWAKLKNDLVGETFPERASQDSIRGILYSKANEYGFEEVTVTSNCVHLSAGPFEGMKEVVNFCGKIIDLNTKKQPPLLLRKMLSDGIDYDTAIGTMDNPLIEYDGKRADLFTATENLNSENAISVFKSAAR